MDENTPINVDIQGKNSGTKAEFNNMLNQHIPKHKKKKKHQEISPWMLMKGYK